MTLNFGNNLFPPRQEILESYDFRDVTRGQSYIEFFAGAITPEEESTLTSYETGDDADIATGGINDRLAQTFTVTTTSWITAISLNGIDSGSNFHIELQNTTSGKPNGEILATTSKNIDPSFRLEKWDFATPIKVAAGTYAIVINGISNRKFRGDETSPTYTGGSVVTSADSGANWTIDTTKDLIFILHGLTKTPYILFPESFETKYSSFVMPTRNLITSETLIGYIDFDLDVGKAINIEGTAILEFEWDNNIVIDNLGDLNGFIKATIYKVDSTDSETEIGSTKTILVKNEASKNITITTRETLSIELTKTSIKRGEKLRLSLDAYVTDHNEGGAANNEISSFDINYDPEDESNKKDIQIKIPFKIDI